MEKQKRLPRSYKIQTKAYEKALKMARKGNTPLASLIELFVTNYGERHYAITHFLKELTGGSYQNPKPKK